VPVAFGIGALAGAGATIASRLLPVGGGLLAIGRCVAQRFGTDFRTDRLGGFLRGVIAIGGGVVAQLGTVITPVSGAISLVGCRVPPVGGLVARGRVAAGVISHPCLRSTKRLALRQCISRPAADAQSREMIAVGR
jgi:hypothetical protein